MENGFINLKLANPYNNTFDFKYNDISLNSSISFSGLNYNIYQKNEVNEECYVFFYFKQLYDF